MTRKKFFIAIATLAVSSNLLFAGDMSGRVAIESKAYPQKFLRGLPEQRNEVVTAGQNQATVFLVIADKEDPSVYTIQSHAFYLSVEGDHDVVMHKAAGEREKFKITDNGDGTVSYQAVWNQKYISVKEDGSVHTSDSLGEGEKFKVQKK